ncbi:hypothetical protein DL765_001143 [Monosporascus sp. GIB2]|nr:hypothetical protein DL765_001143 [Monosporascus sp. GIB2]
MSDTDEFPAFPNARPDRDYRDMHDRVEEIAAAVRALQIDALAKDEQIQENTDTLDIVQQRTENMQIELSALKAQVNSDARSLANRVEAAVEAQSIDTKIASALEGHFTKERLVWAVQPLVSDALSLVVQNQVDMESKLRDINRRLDGLASELKPLASEIQLPPWGVDSTQIGSSSAPDVPPSSPQPPPVERALSVREQVERRVKERSLALGGGDRVRTGDN